MMATQKPPMPIQDLKALRYNFMALQDRRNWMRKISQRLGEWAYVSYAPAPDCLQGYRVGEMREPQNVTKLIAWREWIDGVVETRSRNHANLHALLQCVRICGYEDETDSAEITERLQNLQQLFLDFLEQEWGIRRDEVEGIERDYNYAKDWAYKDLERCVDGRWAKYDLFMLKGRG
jgi:hypothetical protein